MNEALFRVLWFGVGVIVGWVIAWWVVDWLTKRIGFDVDFWHAIELSIRSLPVLDRLKWPEDE